MIKHGHIRVSALVTGTILSGLALSACQRSATNTAARRGARLSCGRDADCALH